MDWNDLRLVAAIIWSRSLTSAAKLLRTTQPTVGRRLASLEKELDDTLFERTASGLVPTPLAQSLLTHLNRMEQSAQAIQRELDANKGALNGRVVVTSLDWLGDHLIAPIAAMFANAHPQVEIELLNEGRMYNLARRDADVAFRFSKFSQENLIQKKVGTAAYGLYASKKYLEVRGQPDFSQGADGHVLTLLHDEATDAPYREWICSLAPKAGVVLRTNGLQSQTAIVLAGTAMAVLPRLVGDKCSDLKLVETPSSSPAQPIFVGFHPDLRKNRRVRLFIDFAVNALSRAHSALNPIDVL